MKIDKLTKEQEELMITIRDEYIAHVDSCGELNETEVRGHVEWLYDLAKLGNPRTIICDSPFACQIAVQYLDDNKTDSEIEEATREAVKNVSYDKAKLSYQATGWRLGLWDLGWTAYADFFERIGVDLKCEHWSRWKELARGNVFSSVQLEGWCTVSRMPKYIKRSDAGGSLHCAEGAAVEFRDGFSVYALWGVRFSKELYDRVISKEITAKEVLTLSNMEQRMAALKYLGNKDMLEAVGAVLVRSEGGYDLYEIKDFFEETEYAVAYACPSTGREYISFVDPEIGRKGDPVLAIASKWGLLKSDWEKIEVHT